MTISLTPDEKAEVKREDFLIRELPGASGTPSGTFHNPVTGKEIHKQPLDSYHLMRRLSQGWQLGPASPELKEKWLIREEELRAAEEARVAEYVASQEHVDEERTRFNEAVTTAVTAVLDKLGVNLPDKSGAEPNQPAPAPEEQENREGTQLQLDLPLDAPSESDSKHVVSQASQPALHLVDLRKE